MTANTSASFLGEKGKVKSKNSINEGTNRHPTVGAFGLTSPDNKFSSEYIYSYGSTLDTYKFAYPNPVPGPTIDKSSG